MTDSDWRVAAFRSALRMIEDAEPRSLVTRARLEAEERGQTIGASDLTDILELATGPDPFLTALGMQVHKWDATSANEAWTSRTDPSSEARRARICQLLGLDAAGSEVLLGKRPIFHDHTVVITAPWSKWYTPERRSAHAFYWPRYCGYLINVKGWPEDNVTALDLASTEVIQRLTDPTRVEANQAKGLVVGYVQSGKTANFTGVVAKAIDAGYRLVVIMTGTIEMLRAQTQRRIDMELVGRQNILGDLSPEQARDSKIDYQEDVAWLNGEFLNLGDGPVATEIIRLTQHRRDYQKQFRTLKIDRFELGVPLYDPRNLYRSSARIAIVKKNSTVLDKLVKDLRANKSAFSEIPVLIIDDESDLASVNTVDPEQVRIAKSEGREIQERRAVNEKIALMLELMPRAQYVGYTATPFANVFVDPSDPQGIFPKDFVIGLSRPAGYMGVADFHDLEELTDEERMSPSLSNEVAFVRHLEAADGDSDLQSNELSKAIDMFVLTGAVKLRRLSVDPSLDFRHHTMLIHSSVRTQVHGQIADDVRALWLDARFAHPEAKSRLRDLYESDVMPVSAGRLEPGVPKLPTFDELAQYIPKAVGRITEHQLNPVIVVNSDKDVQQQQQTLDFDRHGIWRILIGGAKLSRGFTIEGLTVTYFRRATNMSDSLTQMGRWFGFRHGYKDLVRLYIARSAKFGTKSVDLYKAFESVALDEESFRGQLSDYAAWDGDKLRLRPIEIPPLVTQHLPWLAPTARNKMFNAVLEEQSEQPFTGAGYPNRLDQLEDNLETWRPVLAAAGTPMQVGDEFGGAYQAYVGKASQEMVLDAISRSKYLPLYRERSVNPKLAFYRRLVEAKLLEDFLVVVPQPATKLVEVSGIGARAVISRDRREGRRGMFGEITDRKHRPAVAEFVAGAPPTCLQKLHNSTRGALLLYLAKEDNPSYEPSPLPANKAESGLVAAFSLYVPSKVFENLGAVLRFRVLDPSRGDEPSIEAGAS